MSAYVNSDLSRTGLFRFIRSSKIHLRSRIATACTRALHLARLRMLFQVYEAVAELDHILTNAIFVSP
jgi:hypothetical protein